MAFACSEILYSSMKLHLDRSICCWTISAACKPELPFFLPLESISSSPQRCFFRFFHQNNQIGKGAHEASDMVFVMALAQQYDMVLLVIG